MLFKPFELIPAEPVPSAEVLGVGISQPPNRPDRHYSDLFPSDHPGYYRGPLGNYLGGDPQHDHPLYAASQGIYAAHYAFAEQERQNDFKRTEVTSRGLMATMLQQFLASSVAKGYDNALEQMSQRDAVQAVADYIENQNSFCTAEYDAELDYHVASLANLDRGDEEPVPTEVDGLSVISARDIALALDKVPESPEVERERRKEYTAKQINVVRNRLVRLRFEYMSATALAQLLKDA